MKSPKKRHGLGKKRVIKVIGFSNEQIKTIKNQIAIMRLLDNAKANIMKNYKGKMPPEVKTDMLAKARLERFLDKLIKEEIVSRKLFEQRKK